MARVFVFNLLLALALGFCCAQDNCAYNGKEYPPGQFWFVGCESICSCVHDGNGSHAECTERCPLIIPRPGCQVVPDPRDRCCQTQDCVVTTPGVTKPSQSCAYKGQEYALGTQWNDGCDLQCTCRDARSGSAFCTQRCRVIVDTPDCTAEQDPSDTCCKKLVCDYSKYMTSSPSPDTTTVTTPTASTTTATSTAGDQHVETTPSSTPTPTEVTAHTTSSPKCVYKGVEYAQGAHWDEGCASVCTCQDARSGSYTCADRCRVIVDMPDCTAEQDPNDPCCKKLVCDYSKYMTSSPSPDTTTTTAPTASTATTTTSTAGVQHADTITSTAPAATTTQAAAGFQHADTTTTAAPTATTTTATTATTEVQQADTITTTIQTASTTTTATTATTGVQQADTFASTIQTASTTTATTATAGVQHAGTINTTVQTATTTTSTANVGVQHIETQPASTPTATNVTLQTASSSTASRTEFLGLKLWQWGLIWVALLALIIIIACICCCKKKKYNSVQARKASLALPAYINVQARKFSFTIPSYSSSQARKYSIAPPTDHSGARSPMVW